MLAAAARTVIIVAHAASGAVSTAAAASARTTNDLDLARFVWTVVVIMVVGADGDDGQAQQGGKEEKWFHAPTIAPKPPGVNAYQGG